MPATRKQASAPLFEVRESPIHGRGVFAARRIRAGTRILEYVGERITPAEADRRYDDDAMVNHHTLLFKVDRKTVIDAAHEGNEARFINHSCEPNCEAYIEDGRVFIGAIKGIEPGAELFYDYALERDEPWQARWSELYGCRCGAPSCRGTILKKWRKPAAPKRRGAAAGASGKASSKSRPKSPARSR